LDVWKLEAPPVKMVGSISMPMSKQVSSSLVLDESSF